MEGTSNLPGAVTLWSVGHSNRSLDALVDLLAEAGIATLVDVRARPASRRNPQFARASLEAALETAGIAYRFGGRELGGLRRAHADSPHRALAGTGLAAYADHTASETFARGARRLADLASDGRTAMMCAERDPMRCHRSLIADWLSVRGVTVIHLLAPGERERHALRAEARVTDEGLVYDRNTQGSLL